MEEEEKKKYVLTPEDDPSYLEWMQFLTEVTDAGADGESRRRLLQEHFGSVIEGANPRSTGKALFIFGASNNGKSEYAKILRAQLTPPEWQYTSFSLNQLGQNSLLHMEKALLAVDGDYSVDFSAPTSLRVRDDGTLKKIITGDSVEIKKLYQDVRPGTIRSKLMVLSNALPTSMDKTGGFYKRFSFIKFPNYFDPDDPKTDAETASRIIKKCHKAVRDWGIRGWQRWNKQGFKFSTCCDEEELKRELRESNDPVAKFCNEFLEEMSYDHPDFGDGGWKLPIPELFAKFQAWTRNENYRASYSKTVFSQRLRSWLQMENPTMWHRENPLVTRSVKDADGHFRSVRCCLGIRYKVVRPDQVE